MVFNQRNILVYLVKVEAVALTSRGARRNQLATLVQFCTKLSCSLFRLEVRFGRLFKSWTILSRADILEVISDARVV